MGELLTIKVTTNELAAIEDVIDSVSAMIGIDNTDSNKEFSRGVKAYDRILKRNSLPERKYK